MPKLRSAAFYLKNPVYWAHFCRRAIKPFQPDLDTAHWRAEATRWAQDRAEPLDTLLAQLGIAPAGAMPPSLDPAVLETARTRAARSPHKMGGAGHIDLVHAVTRLKRPQAVVETGVAYGWSSLAFLAAMQANRQGRLVSVDRPYPGAGNEPYVGIAVPDEYRERWTVIREPDRNGLYRAVARFPDGIDIAHYDSDKSYRGRMFGYAVLWKALRPGGLFISDDIQDDMAFADFVARKDARYGVTPLGGKYVGMAVKAGA